MGGEYARRANIRSINEKIRMYFRGLATAPAFPGLVVGFVVGVGSVELGRECHVDSCGLYYALRGASFGVVMGDRDAGCVIGGGG